MTKIFWTSHEELIVARRMKELAGNYYPTCNHIKQAQIDVLPEDRRKKTITGTPIIKRLLAVLEANPEQTEPPKQEIKKEPEITKYDQLRLLLKEVLSEYIDGVVEEVIKESINKALPRIQKISTHSLPKDKPKRFTILVGGLLSGQAKVIMREFSGKAYLRFWQVDQNVRLLQSAIDKDTIVIMMTKFISHSHESIVNNAHPAEYIRIDGGLTKLKERISSILERPAQ